MRSLLLFASLFAAVPAQAQLLNTTPSAAPAVSELDRKLAEVKDPAELLQIATRYRQAGDAASEASAWKRLSQVRPHLGAYRYNFAAASALQDKKSETYNALLELQGQGYAFDPRGDQRFAKVTSTEVWTYLLQGFDENRKPFGEGSVLARLPGEDLLIESLAWDPTRKKALVGSAREGTVSVVGADGNLRPLITANAENGMWAVFDLVVDPQRNLLWVASTAVPHFKRYNAEKDLGRAGLFKFELDTGKFIKRFLSPAAPGQSFFMSSLAVAADGTVFAADGVNNAVYMVRDDQLKRLFHAPVLGSVRGMTLSADGKTLYFADYERGLFGFDLTKGAPFEVLPGPKLALGGIEDLVWWRGQLAFVQNGMIPKRIMRAKLSEDGRSVVGVQPVEANREEMPMPTVAALDGDRLIVLGNSQKEGYDRFGLPKDKQKLGRQVLFQTDLTFGETAEAKPD